MDKTTTAKRPVGRPPNKPVTKPAETTENMAATVTTTEAGFGISRLAAAKVEFAQAATLGNQGSKYDALVEVLSGMKPGDPVVLLSPPEGVDPKELRNRITGPIRKKAQPLAGGKLRIRLTTTPANMVAIECVAWPAEEEATE